MLHTQSALRLLSLAVPVLCRLRSAGEAPQWTSRRSREAGTGSIWSTPREKLHIMFQFSLVSSLGTKPGECPVAFPMHFEKAMCWRAPVLQASLGCRNQWSMVRGLRLTNCMFFGHPAWTWSAMPVSCIVVSQRLSQGEAVHSSESEALGYTSVRGCKPPRACARALLEPCTAGLRG